MSASSSDITQKLRQVQLNRFTPYLRNNNQKLDLGHQNLTDADIAEVIACVNQYQVKEVNLGSNKISSQGAKDFAQYNETATTVDLRKNDLGDQGAKDFAQYNKI